MWGGLFIGELLLLFFLSRYVTSSLSRFFYKISHSQSVTVYILAILFLPGTIIHELAHMLVAGVMLVPVGEIDVIPEIQEDGVRLGSAQIGQTDMLRRLIIGVAPILVGLGIIFSLLFLFQESLVLSLSSWKTVAILYVVFEISNTMFSSKKDMEGALAFLLSVIFIFLIIILGLYFTNNFGLLSFFQGFNLPNFSVFFQKSTTILLIPLILDITLLGITRTLRFLGL